MGRESGRRQAQRLRFWNRKSCVYSCVSKMPILRTPVDRRLEKMKLRQIVTCIAAVLLSGCGGQTASEDRAADGERNGAAQPTPPRAPCGYPSPVQPTPTATGNDRCAAPARLTFTGGRIVVSERTSDASDEFVALDCDSRGTAGPLNGPQKYFMLPVRQGHTYTFALTPTFHAVVVGFEATVACTESAIQLACREGGARGFASGLINPGTGKPGATVFATVPPYHAERDTDPATAA